MNESRINEQILRWLKEHCKNDEVLEHFLKELIYEEVEHPGHWKWKDTYKDKIKKFSNERNAKNEN